jgi:dipeptidyl aminopeptidase/acylaminoacyl peptidase
MRLPGEFLSLRSRFGDRAVFRMNPATVVVLLAVASAPAQEARRSHDITIDDYFSQADIFEIALSPDGRNVAFTEGRWQQATDDRKTDLWVVDTTGRSPQRLTFDRASDRSPKWSADGKFVYFIGNRKREGEKRPPYDGKAQVWRLPPAGGDPLATTRAEGGVEAFDLSGNGQTLYYTVERDETDADWQALRQQFRDIDYGHGVRKVHEVWKLDLTTWRASKVIDDKRYIHDFSVSPDGRRIAMITTPDGKVVSFEGRSRVDIFDASTGRITPLPDQAFRAEAPSPYGWLEKLAWASDGGALAFTVIFDAYPAEILVAEWGDNQPVVRKMQRPAGLSLHGYGSPLRWGGPSQDLYFLGEEKARVRLCSFSGVRGSGGGSLQTWTPGDVVVAAFDFDKEGRGVVLQNDPSHLPDVYRLEAGGAARPLTHVNPQADNWKLPQLSVVSWKGANGDLVEGVLELPPDSKPGQRLPLVVEIHGGPTTATHFQLQYWIYGRTLLPAKGYAVLSPNYRGSTGYGDKFLTDLVGRENDLDVEDILKGVDAMVERGIADPGRLGVMGWSNGGYLTNCIITKTTRFKAASSGAGIVDTVMEWGANDEPAYAMVFKQGLPWSRAESYRRTSPTYQLDKVRTPTLLHVGGGDERCPPSQSRMLYRALKEYVQVPTELLVYPGEPHGLMKYKNRKAKMEWDLAWFDKYIRGTPSK